MSENKNDTAETYIKALEGEIHLLRAQVRYSNARWEHFMNRAHKAESELQELKREKNIPHERKGVPATTSSAEEGSKE